MRWLALVMLVVFAGCEQQPIGTRTDYRGADMTVVKGGDTPYYAQRFSMDGHDFIIFYSSVYCGHAIDVVEVK